jgi:hypothetical protein
VLLSDWSHEGGDWQTLLENLALRDHTEFVAGQVHEEIGNWRRVLNEVNNDSSKMVGEWIQNKVDIYQFFQHFVGKFEGIGLNSEIPPPMVFNNYRNCIPHKEEIARHLEEGIMNGSLELLGRVGEVEPPRVVMPLLMVSGTRKSRLCHDERYLNLFMKHKKFFLEGSSLSPTLLEQGDYMAATDEKSAYLGIFISDRSQKFFGLEFGGVVLSVQMSSFRLGGIPFCVSNCGNAGDRVP